MGQFFKPFEFRAVTYYNQRPLQFIECFDGNIYVYDEYYSPGVVSEHAKAIHEKTGEQEISMWVIDPSTRNKTREKKDGSGNAFPWSNLEEYEDHGLYFVPANNEKLAGINRVREFLTINPKRLNPRTGQRGSPKLFIFQSCVNLLWEIPQYQWRKYAKMSQRNPREDARDFNDHACFCRHTSILTNRGNIPIIKVKKGDKVWTPLGWSKVLEKQKTGYKKVVTFRSTKATDNHPLMTQDGFRQLKDLKKTDRLWNVFISGASPTGDTQILSDFPMLSIFAVLKRATRVKLDFFIKTYGFFSKGMLGKVFTYIIKMGITTEMILRILKYLVIPSILTGILSLLGNEPKKEGLSDKKKLELGIKVKQVDDYIRNLVYTSGGPELYNQWIVRNAKGNTKRTFPNNQNSVVSTAKCLCSGSAEVYNLATDTGMYIANNVLVSNCDALRYMIMTRFQSPSLGKDGNALISRIDVQNANLLSTPMKGAADELLGSFETNTITGTKSDYE